MNTTLDLRERRCRAFDGTTGGRLGVGAGRYAVRRNNGDPACWRPVWGTGFDCAALFGCRAHPYIRCAASLRMTRGEPEREAENKMPYQIVSLYYILYQTYMVPRPCNPRVILSEAAPPTKNHARPPTIAAQSNPAPSGAPAGGISVVSAHRVTPRTHPKKPSPGWRKKNRTQFSAPATDEGETGERGRVAQPPRRSPARDANNA